MDENETQLRRRNLIATMAAGLLPERVVSSVCRDEGLKVYDEEWAVVHAYIRNAVRIAQLVVDEAEGK